MRARGVAALAAGVALLAACSAPAEPEAESEPTTQEAATTTAEPESTPSPTTTSPSREAMMKVLADAWGEATDEERVTLCVAYRSYTPDELWEAMGAPDTVTPTEYDLVWADYCQDY